jgi:alpha-tubulin suppressor-like RCC1 family protein
LGVGDDAISIDGGFVHTCALTGAGGVKCWGSNLYGQLGDGTNDDRSTPVNVTGLAGPAAGLSLGGLHTCALLTNGQVQCWGRNHAGQLGDGTRENSATPVTVAGLAGVLSLTTGSNANCAITDGHGLKCWGNNEFGELGDGSVGDGDQDTIDNYETLPTDVSGLSSGVATVTVGQFHTCALTAAGGAKCWGLNFQGQLGTGSTSPDPPFGFATPQDVVGLSTGIAAIEAGGLFTCALTPEGAMKCWGFNLYGQLGDGTHDTRAEPTDVAGLGSGVGAIAPASPGGFHTCAIMASGGATCWGRHEYGQVGDGSFVGTEVTTPQDVAGLGGAPADWDEDGCGDKRELGPAPSLGGSRDPFSAWDFFDVPTGVLLVRDRVIAAADIAGVVSRFGASDTGPGTFDRTSDPLSTPLAATQPSGARQNYHPAYDRGGTMPGQDAWDLEPPDGAISAGDLAALVVQFGHTCA